MVHSGLTTATHNNLFFKLSVENLNSQQRKTSYSTFCLAQSHVLRWCESKWLQWSHFYLQLKAFTTWCNGFVLASGSKNAAPSRIQTLAPLLPNAFKTPNITAPRRLDFRPRYRRHYVGLAPLLRSTAVSRLLLVVKGYVASILDQNMAGSTSAERLYYKVLLFRTCYW